MMKTLVIGLGNPILTDDGVGVKVAYRIRETLEKNPLPDVTVTEASVGGLRLMETLLDYERVFIIDAILPENKEKARTGTYRRITIEDLRNLSPTQHSASAHDTTLVTALDMAERLGFSIPKQIIIYAIDVENVLEFSEKPTANVEKSIPLVTQAIMEELLADNQLTN